MSEILNDGSRAAGQTSERGSPLVTIALAATAVVIVIALLLPATRTAREPARRNQCVNNLKQIALAILHYKTSRGEFPPAYTVDASGRRLHSWRTLILPYMEQMKLYESIDLSKPWDDPANALARAAVVDAYACSSVLLKDEEFTTYLGVTGPHCAFDGSTPRKPADITDDHATTLIVVDAPVDRAVHWMSPHDISQDELLSLWPTSKTQHAEVRTAAFIDAHVRALPKNIDAEVLRSMTTIDEGEASGE